MKRNLVKKLTIMAIIAVLTMGQSFGVLAAEPVYTYKTTYNSDGISTLVRTITATMTGPSNILKFAAYGVYSVRGGGRQVNPDGIQVESTTRVTQIGGQTSFNGQAGDSVYYYAALCCGYYRGNTTAFWKVLAAKDVEFSN